MNRVIWNLSRADSIACCRPDGKLKTIVYDRGDKFLVEYYGTDNRLITAHVFDTLMEAIRYSEGPEE